MESQPSSDSAAAPNYRPPREDSAGVDVTPRPSPSDDASSPDTAVIKVYVRDLDQLFDSMDPSPFHERDLDRNAHEYLVNMAKDLPADAPATLIVYLDHDVGPPEETANLGEAIRVYFARRAEEFRFELRRRLRGGWISLLLGLVLLVASVVVGQYVARRWGSGPVATVVRESLLIGGWVAMWRPMDFFLYQYWSMREELRVYERLSRMLVKIVYTQPHRESAANTVGKIPDIGQCLCFPERPGAPATMPG